jgi:glycosyltransferase involved in cell wall biosynthesis
MKVACIIRSSVFDVRGGDTTQFVKTTEALNRMGIKCDMFRAGEDIDYENYDLLHLYNIIRPADHLKHIKQSGKPYVVSTIYLDYSNFDQYGRGMPYSLVFRLLGKSNAEYVKNLLRYAKGQDKMVSMEYLLGHRRAMREIIKGAAVLLPNSHSEYRRLAEYTGMEHEYIFVPNGIDTGFFQSVHKEVKREKKVICVAQIYGRKNQYRLIQACKKLKVPLDVIGKSPPNHQKYFEMCQTLCDDKIRLAGYIPREDLLKAYATASVHALPSWFETTGLSSLEAGVMGCNLVVGTGGDTHEYFDGFASFCDAGDQESIEKAVEEALSRPHSDDLRDKILSEYTWEKAAERTKEAYERALNHA